MKLTKCPYCGKKINYTRAFFMRNQGEYFCPKCRKESNVVIKKTLFIPFSIAVFLALVILLIFLFLSTKENFWFLLLIALPFIVFYIFTPFFVQLKPKKKHMDSLYDTEMVESAIKVPDPTMARKKRVTPTFIDDVILDDEDYRPTIDADVFNSIKNERKALAETDGGTKPISSFEEISSKNNDTLDKTMPVNNIKTIQNKVKIQADKIDDEIDTKQNENNVENIGEPLVKNEEENNSLTNNKDSKNTNNNYDLSLFE